MVGFSTLLVFVPAVIAVALLPGPSNLLILSRSLTGGKRLGVASVIGGAIGTTAQMSIAALGLAALLTTSALAFTIMKWLGAAYLIYLGIRALLTQTHTDLGAVQPMQPRQAFMQALLTDVLNPKAALFYAAFLPQFVHQNEASSGAQFVVLGLIAVIIFTLNNLLICYSAVSLRGWLNRHPAFLRWQARVMGGLFISLGVRLAFAERD